MKSKTAAIAFLGILFLLPLFINNVSAQDQTDYYITVKPSVLDALQYLSIGRNATITFEARWTYGPSQGAFVQNATATIDVINQKNQKIATLNVNTTSGIFSFNYIINNPDILTFSTTKIVTEDGVEWNSGTHDSNALGLNSNNAQIYWDTFHVSMENYDTDSLGRVEATVKVTYLLVPEEGLVLGSAVQHNKIAHGVKVTINGEEAKETQIGVYTATSSTWLPTAYMNVKVSDNNWTTTATGFSFRQNANQPLWIYGVGLATISIFAALALGRLILKKNNKHQTIKPENYPFSGTVILIVTSVISLYWGIVGLEGTLHTFEWIGLAIFGVFAFIVGVLGSIFILKRTSIALTITAAMIPMLANTIVIKGSLDMYQLPNPWLILFPSLFLSIVCSFFICRLEDSPTNESQKQDSTP